MTAEREATMTMTSVFAHIDAAVIEAKNAYEDELVNYRDEIDGLWQIIRKPTLFKVRDATQFKDRPDLSQYGLKRIKFINQNEFFAKNADQSMPDPSYIENVLIPKLDLLGVDEFVFDIENWPLDTPALVAISKPKYFVILDVFRRLRPTWKITFYNLPLRSINHLRGPIEGRAKRVLDWQARNNAIRDLIDATDFGAPTFYLSLGVARVIDPLERFAYIRSMADETRRVYPRKPILPIMWNAWDTVQTNTIDGGTWRSVLEQLFGLTDGIIIWSMSRDAPIFDYSAPWWLETADFIKQKWIVA